MMWVGQYCMTADAPLHSHQPLRPGKHGRHAARCCVWNYGADGASSNSVLRCMQVHARLSVAPVPCCAASQLHELCVRACPLNGCYHRWPSAHHVVSGQAAVCSQALHGTSAESHPPRKRHSALHAQEVQQALADTALSVRFQEQAPAGLGTSSMVKKLSALLLAACRISPVGPAPCMVLLCCSSVLPVGLLHGGGCRSASGGSAMLLGQNAHGIM